MEEYPGNSKHPTNVPAHREEAKIERVVQGEVIRRKTPRGRRWMQNIIGDDRNFGSFVLGDILLPGIRDTIYDAVTGGLEYRLFPDSAPRGRASRSRSRSGRTNYDQMSRGGPRGSHREERREMSYRGRSNHEFDEIILESRAEAFEVLDRLEDRLDKYGAVSVAEFYELVGITSNFADRKYGWHDIGAAKITRTRGGGYCIYMPKTELID